MRPLPLAGDVEELEELLTPLPQQRTRCDEEHTSSPFSEEQAITRPRFDRLAQTHLVGQDAPALAHSLPSAKMTAST